MIKDIHPTTPITALRRDFSEKERQKTFSIDLVAALVGMNVSFVRKAVGARNGSVSMDDVLFLLDLDCFAETFIPRSQIPDYLLSKTDKEPEYLGLSEKHQLIQGCAKSLIQRLPIGSVQCVVTSTPYWGTRLYSDAFAVAWADGEVCPFGNEQTPEAFVRHTIELLYYLKPSLKKNGSVWWNLMDTYNTRTQIRGNASETLKAMRGEDSRGWGDHDCRRYSAGHSYLKDGEQCHLPSRVAERASRIGYFVKSVITWKKLGSMPEPQNTRVTRELEYIIHFAVDRSPYFNKAAFLEIGSEIGGRNPAYESEKITDVWALRTTSGRDGHGAQFPLALPGRCIAVSTEEGDLVVDPFVGGGTTVIAAQKLGRRAIGFDVSEEYLETAKRLTSQSQLTLQAIGGFAQAARSR